MRCDWAVPTDQVSLAYHDTEWGVPSHDDTHLFEMLVLEGAQAGLSWATILRKREGYRSAFAGFDATAVAKFGAHDVARLMADPAIVRNRMKIQAAISNARVTLAIREEFGSFDAYVWSFVGGTPRVDRFGTVGEIPAQTEESRAMSADLRARGARFVGPTICYAFMQATGMVNDHITSCFRYAGTPSSRPEG